jgi:predicted transcriptional regulator
MAQPINTLMAHKAINLATELSNAEKRVVGTLIEHYNRRTGQCDPSLDCIAELIGMSRRTVIRAIARVQKLGFVRRVRHGGKFHRNHYEPIWSRFVQVEAEWNGRRSLRRARFVTPKASPCPSQPCHDAGDMADTQTSSRILLKETLVERALSAKAEPTLLPIGKSGSANEGAPRKISSNVPNVGRTEIASSATAARDAAERRWNTELFSRYGDKPGLFGQIVDAVDMRLSGAVTDAELGRRGSGLSYLMNELLARDAALKVLAIGRNDDRGGIKSLGP